MQQKADLSVESSFTKKIFDQDDLQNFGLESNRTFRRHMSYAYFINIYKSKSGSADFVK